MKEKFKDSALSPKERAEDLLPRLTLREKVGQVNQKLYGFQSYTCNGEHVELADSFKEEVEKWSGLGVLYGLYRADPWANKDYTTGLTGVNAIRAYNLAQHYVLEHSRFGIPMLMSSECPHGHQALDGLFASGEPRHGAQRGTRSSLKRALRSLANSKKKWAWILRSFPCWTFCVTRAGAEAKSATAKIRTSAVRTLLRR